MKKVSLIALLVVSAALFSFKPSETANNWTLDKAHARLGFAISHMMVSDVEGSFKNFEASITGTKGDFSDAVVQLTADVNSVTTENDKRDEHIKGADYFDVAKYNSLTFKSTSFKKTGDKKYKVTGNLTMRGVTKPVTLDATLATGVNPFNKKEIAGFKITGTIKRSDFGIGASTPAAVLGEEVKLTANAEFNKI